MRDSGSDGDMRENTNGVCGCKRMGGTSIPPSSCTHTCDLHMGRWCCGHLHACTHMVTCRGGHVWVRWVTWMAVSYNARRHGEWGGRPSEMPRPMRWGAGCG